MALLQGIEDIAAIILILELFVMLVAPALLIAYFGRKGMAWVLGKFAWASGTLHTGMATLDKGIHRAEDLTVAPIVLVASFWTGAGATVRSLRRRAEQPLSRLRRSA